MTLDAAVTHANSLGWAVTLVQHPDRFDYWEARLSRACAEPHPHGIIREVTFWISSSPADAIMIASMSFPERIEPTGYTTTDKPMPLSSLLPIRPLKALRR